MCWTDDPVYDAEQYYNKLEKELEKLPVCDECGEYIQDERYYEFDKTIICPSCLEDNHMKWTEV